MDTGPTGMHVRGPFWMRLAAILPWRVPSGLVLRGAALRCRDVVADGQYHLPRFSAANDTFFAKTRSGFLVVDRSRTREVRNRRPVSDHNGDAAILSMLNESARNSRYRLIFQEQSPLSWIPSGCCLCHRSRRAVRLAKVSPWAVVTGTSRKRKCA